MVADDDRDSILDWYLGALFDGHRVAVQSIRALLVERVETRDRQVVGWVPTGPAERFIDSALLSPWRPRTDSSPQQQRGVLDWYLEVG